jgi:hypothetical protein
MKRRWLKRILVAMMLFAVSMNITGHKSLSPQTQGRT